MSKDVPPTITMTGNEQLSQFLGGILDVLVAFGAALANAGVFERADIVAEMDKVLGQKHARDGGKATEAPVLLLAGREQRGQLEIGTFVCPLMQQGRVVTPVVAPSLWPRTGCTSAPTARGSSL